MTGVNTTVISFLSSTYGITLLHLVVHPTNDRTDYRLETFRINVLHRFNGTLPTYHPYLVFIQDTEGHTGLWHVTLQFLLSRHKWLLPFWLEIKSKPWIRLKFSGVCRGGIPFWVYLWTITAGSPFRGRDIDPVQPESLSQRVGSEVQDEEI